MRSRVWRLVYRSLPIIAALFVVAAVTTNSRASLTGDAITADAVWQNSPWGPVSMLSGVVATVDPVLVEFSTPIPGMGGTEFSIDFFADATFTIVFDPADFALWPIQIDVDITDLDFTPPGVLTDVQQTSANVVGFLDVVSFTDDTISISSSVASAAGSTFTATFAYTSSSAGGNTPAGTNVVVQPVDETTATTPVTLTFDEVTVGGETTLVTGASGPAPPTGYSFCDPATYFDLWTTAILGGGSTIEVCIDLGGLSCGVGGLSLQSYEDTTGNGTPDSWVDVTTSSSASEVCGVVSELSTFAVFVPSDEEPCVTIRRTLTGEEPNTISVGFGTGCGPGAQITAIELNLGFGHTVAPTTGITCTPNSHVWTGDGTGYARIEFNPPLQPGDNYTECIVDDLGAYWSSGQSVKVYLSCHLGPVVLSANFDDFYDLTTFKTFRISEAKAGCGAEYSWGFTFDEGSNEGWTMEGAYRETGGAAVASNFSYAWEDECDYPSPVMGDPVDGNIGAIGFTTPGGHGVPSVGNTWWIMRFTSPDLIANPEWQSATGYTVKIGENMAATQTLSANLFVVVYDADLDTDRTFFNGTASLLNLDGWTSYSFDWSGIGTFPTNYAIRSVFVNIWGTMAGTYNGGVYLDDVIPFPIPTAATPPVAQRLSFELHAPSPNPFNPLTTLRFDLSKSARVDLRIYNLAGRLVRELLDDVAFEAGNFEETWNGRDDYGRVAASGVYVVSMGVEAEVRTRRVVLLK